MVAKLPLGVQSSGATIDCDNGFAVVYYRQKAGYHLVCDGAGGWNSVGKTKIAESCRLKSLSALYRYTYLTFNFCA